MPNTSDYPFNQSPPPRKLVIAGRLSKDKPIRVLRTPKLQSDAERGQGDSINARLHRLLAPRSTK